MIIDSMEASRNDISANWKFYVAMIVINSFVALCLISYMGLKPDYRSYYAAGVASRTAPHTLYDWKSQEILQRELFGDFVLLPFFHPPLELPLFAGLSKLPYIYSLNLWRLFSMGLLGASGVMLARITKQNALMLTLLLAAMVPMAACVVEGQDSIMLLLIISATFYLLRNDQDFAAGVLLASALFKPQVPIILAIALFAIGRKRFVTVFVAASAVITAASFLYMGGSGLQQILECTRFTEGRLPISEMPSIRGLISVVAGDQRILSAAALVLCLLFIFPVWRRARSLSFVFATAICVGCLAALHVFTYDLTLLAIPLALLIATPQKRDAPLVALLTSGPLYLLVYAPKLECVFVIPTIMLCVSCFRLMPKALGINPQVATATTASQC